MAKIPSIDPEHLGRRLAEARKSRGITQQDAANHLQCSRPTLIAVEKGTRVAKPEEIVALAALYGPMGILPFNNNKMWSSEK